MVGTIITAATIAWLLSSSSSGKSEKETKDVISCKRDDALKIDFSRLSPFWHKDDYLPSLRDDSENDITYNYNLNITNIHFHNHYHYHFREEI